MTTLPRWKGRLDFSTPGGKVLRLRLHERDDYTCQECGWKPDDETISYYDGSAAIGSWQFPAERELQVDHIMPRSRGGSSAPDNLQTLCAPCNGRKSARLS